MNGFIFALFILFIFSPFAYAYISVTEKDKRTDYPGKEISMKVQNEWNKNYDIPINVVLGNEWNAGNLSYHLETRPTWEGNISTESLDKLNKFLCFDNVCVGSR